MATKLKDHDAAAAPSNGPAQADDFAAWAFHQATLMRAGQFDLLNVEEIAEELDGLGRGEFHALVSHLRIVLTHLLKWDHQPERRSRSWHMSIAEHRDRVVQSLQDNPSFMTRRPQAVERAYASARRMAAGETDLPIKIFPESCPYDWNEVMTRPIALDGD